MFLQSLFGAKTREEKKSNEKLTFFAAQEEYIYEPVHEKNNSLEFQPGLTQTGLYSHKSRLGS